MKRKLNEKEKEMTEKGVKRLNEEISELQNNLDYNQALIDKQKYLRDFDDIWRDYLRNTKDEDDKRLLKQIDNLFKQKADTIHNLQKQLKEGVEESNAIGWNLKQ